jgi:3-deoxy-D-manno-octulosonic-acid transferase
MYLYQLFLWLYPLIARCISPFNTKGKQWLIGQNEVWNQINQLIPKIKQPIVWIHCASYGEFEQGLPIIEKLKSNYPNHQIWLTFFSPSGYLHRKNDPSVDFVTYLPFDGAKNAKQFIEIIQPKLIVFIKYEFWYYYLNEAKKQNIPTLLVSTIFRPGQIFFQFYGGFYKKMLGLFSCILVQDKSSFDLIKTGWPNLKIEITGDTRYDRVFQTAALITKFDWIQKLNQNKIIIAGSTWKEDHALLAIASKSLQKINWIIVPHHVDYNAIDECKTYFPNAITLTELQNSNQHFTLPTIIIIDQIGILRNLYQYAYISYVGGGFGKEGVHNVLEPAAFGQPVIWGEKDEKYIEAVGLRKAGGGFKIKSANEFIVLAQALIFNEEKYQEAAAQAKKFISSNAGATHKTIQFIKDQQLLP